MESMCQLCTVYLRVQITKYNDKYWYIERDIISTKVTIARGIVARVHDSTIVISRDCKHIYISTESNAFENTRAAAAAAAATTSQLSLFVP